MARKRDEIDPQYRSEWDRGYRDGMADANDAAERQAAYDDGYELGAEEMTAKAES